MPICHVCKKHSSDERRCNLCGASMTMTQSHARPAVPGRDPAATAVPAAAVRDEDAINWASILSAVALLGALLIFAYVVKPGDGRTRESNLLLGTTLIISFTGCILFSFCASIYAAYFSRKERFRRISHFVVILFVLAIFGLCRKLLSGR